MPKRQKRVKPHFITTTEGKNKNIKKMEKNIIVQGGTDRKVPMAGATPRLKGARAEARRDSGGYVGAVVEPPARIPGRPCAWASREARPGVTAGGENEGGESSLAAGCNAHNGNASARTLYGNYALGYNNGNYAGAFADRTEKEGTSPASCAASTKTNDGRTATGVCGRCDYGQLPFWDSGDKAESNAQDCRKDTAASDENDVWTALLRANGKRKLKGLERYLTDMRVIEKAFDKVVAGANLTAGERRQWTHRRQAVCERIRREIKERTYRSGTPVERDVTARWKGVKRRMALVYPLYDRVVQMVLYLVVGVKLGRKAVRNVYSGLKGRSLLSRDRRYCLVTRARHAVATAGQNAWAGLTDVRKFYESVSVKIVLGVTFKTLVCPVGRWLLTEILAPVRCLPIGCCLSQVLSALVLGDCDREVLRRYRVRYFAFGDNRLAIGTRHEAREVMSWQTSYYAGALCLDVKDDRQMRRVRDGLAFCRYQFKGTSVRVRGEIRRRAIRSFLRGGRRGLAGYRGMLLKTDSHRLLHLIETMQITNRHGMTVTTQRGDKVKLRDVKEETVVVPVEHRIERSVAKERDGKTGWMVRMTYIQLLADGRRRLCHTTEGSEEVVEYFRLVERGGAPEHERLHVLVCGTKVAFREYHTTAQEACDAICKELGL